MSRNIDLSGLKNVRDKLQRLKAITNDDIAMVVAERGKDLAQSKYGGDVVVTAESLGGGKAKVIASGEKVAFYEYGYGVEGRDSAYQGQLPTEPITFESAGNTHTTQGWEYYYPNSKTKRTVGGQEGWFHNKKFVTGQSAQAQMWRTANELEQGEAKKAIEQLFKERDI